MASTFKNQGLDVGVLDDATGNMYTAPGGTYAVIHALYISNKSSTNSAKVNVKVTESIQGLGQLQVGIAERQIQNQRLLASNAENTAEKIASRQLAASEKANMAQQRESSGDLDPVKSGFGGGGGILGNMFGTLGSVLDTGLSLLGGGRRGIAGRMSRAGRAAQRRQGFSTAMDGGVGIRGINFRDTTTTSTTPDPYTHLTPPTTYPG